MHEDLVYKKLESDNETSEAGREGEEGEVYKVSLFVHLVAFTLCVSS